MDKQDFRKKLIAERKALSAGEVQFRSQQIFRKFLSAAESFADNDVRAIAFYFPIRGEVDTRALFRHFQSRQKTCLFPKVSGDRMDFYPVRDWSELQVGTFGIGEPQVGPSAPSVRPDLVFVPGVAFSPDLYRIGFGAGFYDRAIHAWKAEGSKSSVRLVALAYDFQILPSLPREPHDHAMDYIVTESRVFPEPRLA